MEDHRTTPADAAMPMSELELATVLDGLGEGWTITQPGEDGNLLWCAEYREKRDGHDTRRYVMAPTALKLAARLMATVDNADA